MCMCICVWIRACVCEYAHVNVHVYVHVYAYVCGSIQVCTCVCTTGNLVRKLVGPMLGPRMGRWARIGLKLQFWPKILCGNYAGSSGNSFGNLWGLPPIGQIIDICLHFTSLEQLSGAVDRSDH